MKKLLLYLLLFIMAYMMISCSPDVHWGYKKTTATGKHNYLYAGWPYTYNCPVYSRQLPVKNSTYWRHNKYRAKRRF